MTRQPPLFRSTPWPVTWVRAVRSPQAAARRNALEAARVLAERRQQREEAERFLAARSRERASRALRFRTV